MNAHERELLKLINSREFDCDEFYTRIDRLVTANQKSNQQESDSDE